MPITFTFQIDPEHIRLRDSQTGYRQELKNRAVVGQEHGFLLALGEPEDKVRSRLGASLEKKPVQIRTCLLFGADGAELPVEIQAMKYFTRTLHRQSQEARPWAYFTTKLVNGFDYVITLQGYEDFPQARRAALEGVLQAHLRIRRLVINAKEVQIPLWRRNLEAGLHRLFAQVLPIVALALGYLNMPAAIAASPVTFLAYLMAITYLFYYGGRVVWMLLARWLVPLDYRLPVLQGLRERLPRIDRWLAERIWGASL